MSCDYESSECLQFVEEALALLDQFQWVFNFHVTHLLELNVLSEIPERWKNALSNMTTEDLNALPRSDIKTNWPEFLVKFSQDCHRLKFPLLLVADEKLYEDNSKNNANELPAQTTNKLCTNKIRGVPAKKVMEVSKLSECIHNECKAIGVTHILDMGSGLGYLGQTLHTSYGYRVLGLESQTSFVQTATKKQQLSCGSETSVIFKQFHMEVGHRGIDEAAEEVREWFEKSAGPARCVHEEHNDQYLKLMSRPVAALVGLHTCGDLAASTLRLFTSSSFFSVLVLSPCCLHKITCLEGEEGRFQNFPLSSMLATKVDTMDSLKFLCKPFFRLAAQRSDLKWTQQSEDEHKQHSKHVLSRAVLQLYASKNKMTIRKTRRRALGKSSLHASGVDMVKHMMSRYELTVPQEEKATEETRAQHLHQVIQLYNEHKHLCPLIEGLTSMQTTLQGVAERLVVMDMQALLAENGAPHNKVVPLWDEVRSPRARAIVATRQPLEA